MLKAILFDLDGTLWFQSPPVTDFTAITAKQAAQVEAAFPDFRSSMPLEEVVAGFWSRFSECDRGADLSLVEVDCGALAQDVLRDALRETLDSSAGATFWSSLKLSLREFNVMLFDDAASTLAEVKARGFRTAVITNNINPALESDFTDFGIAPFIDAFVTSREAGFRKPHARPFELALRALDARPDEALMVGDSYESDILGAVKAGIPSVLKLNDRDQHAVWTEAAYVIRGLSELPSLLDQIAAREYVVSAGRAGTARPGRSRPFDQRGGVS